MTGDGEFEPMTERERTLRAIRLWAEEEEPGPGPTPPQETWTWPKRNYMSGWNQFRWRLIQAIDKAIEQGPPQSEVDPR